MTLKDARQIASWLCGGTALFAHFYVHDEWSAVLLMLLAIWVKL
ncbi:MAG TPA: hypothetical protein VJQ82_17990 [Terriglobales bacterium]|nr:hypothetical protein [Terriglobales bacterium]